jgi:hypothetical protein
MRRPVVANCHLRSSSMTDEDVQELIALLHEAQTEWVNGTFNSLFDLSQATVFPPVDTASSSAVSTGARAGGRGARIAHGRRSRGRVGARVRGQGRARFEGRAGCLEVVRRTVLTRRRNILISRARGCEPVCGSGSRHRRARLDRRLAPRERAPNDAQNVTR